MKYGKYYSAAAADDMVDISGIYSGSVSDGSRYSKNKNDNNNGGNKKKIIIIASIAAAVVVALGVAGFCIMNANKTPAEEEPSEFVFAENTAVSGVDISGKTLAEAKKLLEARQSDFISPVRFSVNIGESSETLNQDNFEYTFDIDSVLEQIKAETEKPDGSTTEPVKDYKIKATVTEDSVVKSVGEICEKYDTEAVNAYVSDFHPYAENRFDYVEEIDGYTVNSDDLKQNILSAFERGENYASIDALVDSKEAEVTVEFLKENIVKLASYETYSVNGANGNNNMRISLEACNGSIIDPGEQWSFNECTGDSNQESLGYKPAGVISNGKSTIGVGGGICQSSSTIYNAAIRANMTIVERYCHKWASVYVPTGLDATIDYPGLDLTLQNDSGYQMFLECKMVGTTLYASFWGYQDSSYDEIKTRNELGKKGSSSYSVKAWREYYKDGKKVGEEELPSSTYDLENGVVFTSADNDTRAESGNVDSLEANTAPPETTQASQSSTVQSSAQPTTVHTEPSYVAPETQAAYATDAPQESHESEEPESEETEE